MGWQGRGNQADFHVDPNDQIQKARFRRERRLQDEAEYQRTRMEREARAAERRLQYEVEEAERRKKRETALARSYALLFRHMTDEQRNMLETENRFLVMSQSGRIYEIRRGMHQNVYLLNNQGHPVEQLCCLPSGGCPEGDVMLAQMLYLMTDEERFRQRANRWELQDMNGNQRDRRLPLTDGARQLDRAAA